MTSSTEEQVAALRTLLDTELAKQLAPQFGCWPLLVGIGGVVLGLVLLLEWL